MELRIAAGLMGEIIGAAVPREPAALSTGFFGEQPLCLNAITSICWFSGAVLTLGLVPQVS